MEAGRKRIGKSYAARRGQKGRSRNAFEEAEQMLLTQRYTRKRSRWVSAVRIR